jgi:hypothetical protein
LEEDTAAMKEVVLHFHQHHQSFSPLTTLIQEWSFFSR